jgi:lysophospholipase L1-like esterase
MGNSITEFWPYNDTTFFESNGYINRGISGQTTPQMLVRFRPDVIALHPDVVVILAGINDIAQNTGPIALEHIMGNIATMAQLAQINKIKVVLCSVLPAIDFNWRPGLEPADKIIRLNSMIKSYCDENDIVYVDYWSNMQDGHKAWIKNTLTMECIRISRL